MPRHLLHILDIPKDDAPKLLKRAVEMKAGPLWGQALSQKTVILIFEKASTRTRVSFEVGVRQMGGQSMLMTPAESQLGRSEPLEDTARVLSRFCDCLVVRTFGQNVLETLAEYATIPVVNALSDMYHPCQIMSDVLTMHEVKPDLENVRAAYVGDGNNMAHSLVNGAARFPYTMVLACPKGYEPDPEILDRARAEGAKIELTDDPNEAVAGAHFVHTDTWASMGQEAEKAEREAAFVGYQVDQAMMDKAAPGAKFMHCLPAYRGMEVSADVFESDASIVFDQAENRLHMQKALLEWVFAG